MDMCLTLSTTAHDRLQALVPSLDVPRFAMDICSAFTHKTCEVIQGLGCWLGNHETLVETALHEPDYYRSKNLESVNRKHFRVTNIK